MKRVYLPLILFLVLALEGVALELLPSNLLRTDLLIVPHWVLVILVFLTIFYDYDSTYFSVMYALIFGLLVDVVYTDVLGVYMFSYALTIYAIHSMKKLLHGNIFVTVLLGAGGLVLSDIMIYLIYMVVGLTDTVWVDYLSSRLLPTVLSNLLFLLVLYPFLAKRLMNWRKEQINKDSML